MTYADLYWAIETVDSNGNVGQFCSLEVISGVPYISYYNAEDSNLMYAVKSGNWNTETVDSNGNVGQFCSLEVISGVPYISYYNAEDSNLMYAVKSGSWNTETVDSAGDVGMYSSLAIDSSGNAHIAYYNETSGDLKYAYYDGTWIIETVDSGGDVGSYCSLALDGFTPCISYYNASNNMLKYTEKSGGNWINQTIDFCNGYSSIAIYNSNPYIAYYTGNNNLGYAVHTTEWLTETVDSNGNVGQFCSLEVISGVPYISYYDASDNDLLYAVKSGSWNTENIASSGNIGKYCSISVDSTNPYFACYDQSDGDCVFISEKDADPPSAPYSLIVFEQDYSIELSWSAPTSNGGAPITNYNIYRGPSPTELNKHDTIVNITYYEDTDVENGETYYYTVSAVNPVGESAQSSYIDATIPIVPPSRPVGFNAVGHDGYVTLTWNPPENDGGSEITSYKLYRGTSETSLSVIPSSIDESKEEYIDDTVTNGLKYYYQLSAINSEGEGEKSPIRSATPEGGPEAPLNLEPIYFNKTVILSWNAPNNDGGSTIFKYNIYRGNSSDSLSLLTDITPTDDLTYTDTSLEIGQAYHYAVTAVNAHGESPKSNTVHVTEPDSPKTFSVIGYDEYVDISWSKPDEHNAKINSFILYRGRSESTITYLTEVNENMFSYRDSNVENGVTYYYQVSAINDIGESRRTSYIAVIPKGISSIPLNLSLSFRGGLFQSPSIKLSWDPPVDDGGTVIEYYTIYKSGNESSLQEYVTVSASSLTYIDWNVSDNNKYYYAISSVNEIGSSNQTEPISMEVPSYLIYYVIMVGSIIVVLIIIRTKIAAFKAYLQYNKIKQRLKSFKKKDDTLLVEDIEKLLEKKVGESILRAERLLKLRERQYTEFNKMQEELQDINLKIEALAQRLSGGDLTSDAFKRARSNLEREKKDIQEKFWKLRNLLFKEEYEKPF